MNFNRSRILDKLTVNESKFIVLSFNINFITEKHIKLNIKQKRTTTSRKITFEGVFLFSINTCVNHTNNRTFPIANSQPTNLSNTLKLYAFDLQIPGNQK